MNLHDVSVARQLSDEARKHAGCATEQSAYVHQAWQSWLEMHAHELLDALGEAWVGLKAMDQQLTAVRGEVEHLTAAIRERDDRLETLDKGFRVAIGRTPKERLEFVNAALRGWTRWEEP